MGRNAKVKAEGVKAGEEWGAAQVCLRVGVLFVCVCVWEVVLRLNRSCGCLCLCNPAWQWIHGCDVRVRVCMRVRVNVCM